MRVVRSKQLQGINGIKEFSGKWLNSVFQPCCLLWLCASHHFPIHCSDNHFQRKKFYNVKSQIISKNTLYYEKQGVFLHSGSLRKVFHFTVRIVISANYSKSISVILDFKLSLCSEYIVSFWVDPRRRNYICRRFGTLYLFHLHRLDMKYDLTFLKLCYISSTFSSGFNFCGSSY